MTKILLLTTIYPSPDISISNNTQVVHYFAREWVKMGYDVRVVFNYPIYLRALHWIARIMRNKLASRFNTSVTVTYTNKNYEFEMDGVKVIRMPLFKPLPHFAVPRKNIDKQIRKIAAYCKREDFEPDVIVAHNFYPHLEMVNRLKSEYYPKAKSCIVVHEQALKMLNYVPDYKKAIADVDVWGYRSKSLKRSFEEYIGFEPKKWFMCYSGIPAHFLNRRQICDVSKPINRFVYVGSFIKRKYPEKLLSAIRQCHLKDFTLDYVGDGVNRKIIEKTVKECGWESKVTLHGFVQREEVPNFVGKAQCFIMISKAETFGLVYLEAMSLGCITIASRNEGMEGIIEDGVNGFLCEAGNDVELAKIIDHINTLPQETISMISKNAIATSKKLTDQKVAEHYIESILNI